MATDVLLPPREWRPSDWWKLAGLGGLYGWILMFATALSNPFDVEVSQAVYYVATNGSDSNPGTLAQPFASCQKAANTAVAGDVVQFRGGVYTTYNCAFTTSGTSGNPIVFQNYPGETPILDASHLPQVFATRWSNAVGIMRIFGNYITIDGLEVRESPNIGIRSSGDNVIIENNVVHDTLLIGIFINNTDNPSGVIIRNNHVYNAFDFNELNPSDPNDGNDADCIQLGGDFDASGNEVIIEGNRVHDCSDDGIDTWQNGENTIRNNIVYDVGYEPGTSNPAGNGNAYKLGGGSGLGGNTYVHNNIAYNCLSRGYDQNGGAANTYHNNTSVDCNNNFGSAGGTLINNLCYTGSCPSVGGTTNSWNLGTGDPLFVSIDPDNASFMELQSGSPAIDVGTNVGLPYNGTAPDLGAKESNY